MQAPTGLCHPFAQRSPQNSRVPHFLDSGIGVMMSGYLPGSRCTLGKGMQGVSTVCMERWGQSPVASHPAPLPQVPPPQDGFPAMERRGAVCCQAWSSGLTTPPGDVDPHLCTSETLTPASPPTINRFGAQTTDQGLLQAHPTTSPPRAYPWTPGGPAGARIPPSPPPGSPVPSLSPQPRVQLSRAGLASPQVRV